MYSAQEPNLNTRCSATDWHCHILPGIDDGSATTDESLAMARALRGAGYTSVHCTPHLIRGAYESDNGTVRRAITALQSEIDRERIDLRLLPGREYCLDEFLPDILKDPLPLGDTRFILIEIPGHVPADYVKESCFRIKRNGYTPLIAHPERCGLLKPVKNEDCPKRSLWSTIFSPAHKNRDAEPKEPSLLGYLQEIGCGFQGNLGSFVGLYGAKVRHSAEKLRKSGVYSHYGTDLHSCNNMERILDTLMDATEDVQANGAHVSSR